MPTLTYFDMSITVDHAVRGKDYVHGYGSDGTCIATFDGLADVSIVGYDGVFMAPEECVEDPCNNVKHVGGALLREDGKEATHSHNASDINDGTLSYARLPIVPVSKGGTGASTAASALEKLGALPKAGGVMTGGLTIKGLVLTSGTDYGTTLPAAGTAGKLFFKKVSS